MAERCGRVALHAHYEAKQKRILDHAEATRRQRLGFGAADRGDKASRAAASAAAEAEAAAAAAAREEEEDSEWETDEDEDENAPWARPVVHSHPPPQL